MMTQRKLRTDSLAMDILIVAVFWDTDRRSSSEEGLEGGLEGDAEVIFFFSGYTIVS